MYLTTIHANRTFEGTSNLTQKHVLTTFIFGLVRHIQFGKLVPVHAQFTRPLGKAQYILLALTYTDYLQYFPSQNPEFIV